jgi:cyclopropane fatty-acyl-phospholipid synthase-like methyltransferase
VTSKFIGANHEFHSKEFAQGWVERFEPTPERIRLFDLIVSQLQDSIPADGNIIELGLGPGYLAKYLLDRMPDVSYHGIDFSLPMLEIAQDRLRQHSSRVFYTQADLVKHSWEKNIAKPVYAVISTWALHDLGSPENINRVYQRSYTALDSRGVLLNGDFIKPEEAKQEFEVGRLYINEHLELLNSVGFTNVSCLSLFEKEIEDPTPAQNYACIRAEKYIK